MSKHRTFGEYLKSKREAVEPALSMRRLAMQVGVTVGYISRMEADMIESPPSASLLGKVAKAIGCPEEEMLLAAGRVPDTVASYLFEHPEVMAKIKRSAKRAASR